MIRDPITVEFRVSSQFPIVPPVILVTDSSAFESVGILVTGGELNLTWMHDTKCKYYL